MTRHLPCTTVHVEGCRLCVAKYATEELSAEGMEHVWFPSSAASTLGAATTRDWSTYCVQFSPPKPF